MEDGILGGGEPVVSVRLQSGQLPRQAREVAGRIPGHVLRVLRAHLRTENPTPPRPLYALLSPSGSGAGLYALRLLIGSLGRFSRLSEGLQFLAQVFTLLLCLFTPAAFLFKLLHRLASFILERGLCSFG